jgi:hypothetical protein
MNHEVTKGTKRCPTFRVAPQGGRRKMQIEIQKQEVPLRGDVPELK